MRNILLIIVFTFLCFTQFSYCQEDKQNSEINSTVPELFAYHDVIYPMWHTAYPNKDYKMLKELLPKVTEGAEKIYQAKLPGILRDKENEWKKGIEKFQLSVKNYEEACNKDENDMMLASAEKLHSDYEMLVRIIRPVTKEVDEFHKVLYMIYHHYWPDGDMIEFKEAVDDLDELAAELNNCVLPKWAADKSGAFTEQSQKLYESTQSLKALKDSDADNVEIDKAIENVHSNYVALEGLFDE